MVKLSEELTPYLESIKQYCINKRLTISVAESVTAGAIQLILSNAEHAQDFFQGGITVYNCSQKSIHLNVDPIYAERVNGVSDVLSIELAKGVCDKFRSQIGIGITGYATLVPELGIEELYAFLAVVMNGKLIIVEKILPEAEGVAAQFEYAVRSILLLSDYITGETQTR